MKALESFNVLESFGFCGSGIFQEVSEIEMSDVMGGSCGAGIGGCVAPPPCYQDTCYLGDPMGGH